MAKTVCLIRPNPPLFYFANTLHRDRPLTLAVVETRPPRPLTRLWRNVRPPASTPAGIDPARLPRRATGMQQARDCQRFFENDWRFLDPSIPLLVVPDINAPIVRQRLADIKPDVVLDHGTGIVRDELIESVPLALNVHWGLSPYYRGTHCTEWALVNWDPYNIGVTLHRLSREIDGGGVVSQARAQITPDDTVHSINMQLTQLGTALARGALTRLDQGHQLVFHSQDHAQGLLTLNRQWSRTLTRQMRYIENQGLIGRMLKHPARRARLPIVELAD
ncbi:MAG TPA: formyl transferase [Pirellulales bacterium]|jgi:hypothetical protein